MKVNSEWRSFILVVINRELSIPLELININKLLKHTHLRPPISSPSTNKI